LKKLLTFALLIACTTATGTNAALANKTEKKEEIKFDLVVPNKPFASLPGLLPNAAGHVTLIPGEKTDRLFIKVEGLPANLDYVVFLTEVPVGPFGAVQYIADFKTNADGRAEVIVNAVILEAFAFSLNCPVCSPPHGAFPRTQLDHLVIWPADPNTFRAATGIAKVGNDVAIDPSGTTIVTPFDSDGSAGPAILTDNQQIGPFSVAP
jgi:hypothetical protein